jgi:hypothetical protein
MPTLLDAFINGQKANEGAEPVGGPAQPSAPFQAGAEWVQQVLERAINQGDADLGPAQVSLQLDVNLDPQSTNHVHRISALPRIAKASALSARIRSMCEATMSGCTKPTRRAAISETSISAVPIAFKLCLRMPQRSSVK